MSQDSATIQRELKFIEESFKAGIITRQEYETAKKRIDEKLDLVKKEEEKAEIEKSKLEQVIKPETKTDSEEFKGEEKPKLEVYHEETPKEKESLNEEELKEKEIQPETPRWRSGESPKKEWPERNGGTEQKEEKLKVYHEETPKEKEPIKEKEVPKEESWTPYKEEKTEKSKKEKSKLKLATYGKNIFSLKKSKSLIVISAILLLIILFFSFNLDTLPIEEKFVPACEFDLDCYKPGYIGKCLNASTKSAECVFESAVTVNITIITSGKCALCDIERMQNTLSQLYPGAKYIVLESTDIGAKKLISKMSIDFLPAYIFDSSVKDSGRFNSTKQILIQKGDLYLMKPIAAGSSFFFKNKKSNLVELFINPSASSSLAAVDNLQELMEKYDIDPVINYYTKKEVSLDDSDIKEILNQVCIKERSEDSLIPYLTCLSKEGNDEDGRSKCINTYSLDTERIEACISNNGKDLLEEDLRKAEEFSINTVPVFIFNNQYKKGGSLSLELLEEVFCKINPANC